MENVFPMKHYPWYTKKLPIPTNNKNAKDDSKWRMAMVEELEDLCKKNTWVLTPLSKGKKAVSYEWVYAAKQNADIKTESNKARLMARGVH
jgi:hypothetical protein